MLEIKNISKKYPGVQALDDVSFNLEAGEVMALLGENGAGKSTLVKILSGAVARDSGDILLDGKMFPRRLTPAQARKAGIAIIYQELSLLSQLTVAENIFLTREPSLCGGWIDYKTMNKAAREQLAKLKADFIDVTRKAAALSLPEQQMVEIAKALAVDCKVIIMDEPTTSLTWEETSELFGVIEALRSCGIAVIYISHRMDEIAAIAQSAAVLRDGRLVGKVSVRETPQESVIEMMTGKMLDYSARHQDGGIEYQQENIILSVRNLGDGKQVNDISFDVYKNEVLGFAGLTGSKRTETARLICGADIARRGDITLRGRKIKARTPAASIKNGIGYLSENRKEEGLNLGMTNRENVVISALLKVSVFLYINFKKVHSIFEMYKKSINIKGDALTPASNLSGGNQQKVVIAKWLHSGCGILFFDEPTRGIDVAAKAEIYKLI
jgi:ribose transport system ATP-binding protein